LSLWLRGQVIIFLKYDLLALRVRNYQASYECKVTNLQERRSLTTIRRNWKDISPRLGLGWLILIGSGVFRVSHQLYCLTSYYFPMLVPAELIGFIFSFLRGERSTLEACSKAHPMLSRLAEPYVYADILVPINNESAVAGLYKRFSENSRMLDFPRTLEFRRTGVFLRNVDPTPEVLLIMSMIPRMTNLTSLTLKEQPCLDGLYGDFLLTFGDCLQQSAIEEIYLGDFEYFPLSILNNGKNIKKLTLIAPRYRRMIRQFPLPTNPL